jgi:hypothetical protein
MHTKLFSDSEILSKDCLNANLVLFVNSGSKVCSNYAEVNPDRVEEYSPFLLVFLH